MRQKAPHPKSFVYFLSAIIIGCFPVKGSAQVSWSASLIPDSLLKNAHSVLRISEEVFTVYSTTKTVDKIHEVYTILDEQGKRNQEFSMYNSSFRKLDDAEINVYNAQGVLIQHVKQKQMITEGYGEELVDDGSYTYFPVTAPSYPITVEFTYSVESKATNGYTYFDLDNREMSIQSTQLTLVIPKSMTFRYHNNHVAIKPLVIDMDKDNKSYTWKAVGIKAVQGEVNVPSDSRPYVEMAPNQFDMAGFSGDMSTWKQFGEWNYNLNKASYNLSDASKAFYQQMVSGAKTDQEKARILYDYLQRNFRYVAIELGIGGFRSFPASFTEKKKYGDCKALSTYMKACLDAVGVKSYTALINAGYNKSPLDPDFPVSSFNHMILCIPQPKDSIWLECTSNSLTFGVLSGFTENRNALLITENGGVLVSTPRSRPDENIANVSSLVHLTADGGGTADVIRSTTGEIKDWDLNLNNQTQDHQRTYLMHDLDYGQPDNFTVKLEGVDSPELKEQLHLSFEKVPEFTSGDKMFLNPRLYHIWKNNIPQDTIRTNDAYVEEYPFTKSDTTCYQLPDGYTVDDLPKGLQLSCPYATYQSNYWYDLAHKAVYSYARMCLKTTRIPAGDYSNFKKFMDAIFEDETTKIVIDKP